ncbi:MAG: hypothetical protein RIR09_1913 [Pseudomonadota bacterium]|jgi:AcrR family transcriptional regulator
MRYRPDHKQGARERLIDATGTLAKKNGFAATGVDSLMASAGLTSGAFYTHFKSKGELLQAIVKNELTRSVELFSNKTVAQTVTAIEGYLSLAHVAHPEAGCAVPSLAAEVSRSDEPTQRVFEVGMVALKDQINAFVHDDAKAWSIIAQLVGAVMVARAMHSEPVRVALLDAATQQVKQILMDAPMSHRK